MQLFVGRAVPEITGTTDCRNGPHRWPAILEVVARVSPPSALVVRPRGGLRDPAVVRAAVVLLTLAAVIAFWWVATSELHLISPGSFPSMTEAREAFMQVVSTGYPNATLLEHCVHSLRLIVVGFALAVALAIPLGTLMATSDRAYALLNPVFLLLRPIPPLAWIPLAILWFGLGDIAKLFVIVCGALPPALIGTITGIRNIDRPIVEAARMLGTPPSRLATRVLLPAALPDLFTGLRISLQASWTTLVAAELVGSLAGLGHVLNAAQQDIFPAMILVAMIAVAMLGWSTSAILGLIERRLMHRRGRT